MNRSYHREGAFETVGIHAYWRWLRLPEGHGTRTSTLLFDPFVSGYFWIDDQAKADTLAARREGRTYPPIDVVDTTWQVP